MRKEALVGTSQPSQLVAAVAASVSASVLEIYAMGTPTAKRLGKRKRGGDVRAMLSGANPFVDAAFWMGNL